MCKSVTWECCVLCTCGVCQNSKDPYPGELGTVGEQRPRAGRSERKSRNYYNMGSATEHLAYAQREEQPTYYIVKAAAGPA